MFDFDPHDTMLFGSGNRLLVTKGAASRVNEAAADAASFRRRVGQAFAEAKARGIPNPILVGSIPFDVARPSALSIPESYQWLEVDAVPPRAAGAPRRRTVTVAPDRGRQEFQGAVRELLETFRGGRLAKVVLSRSLDVPLGDGVTWRDVLPGLLRNAAAYRFAVPLGQGSCLVGASPELLIRKTGERIVSNPLAGSAVPARFPSREAADHYLKTSAKDRHEHRLVVDAVRGALVPFCEQLDVPGEPSVLSLSTLLHLSTEIHGRVTRTDVNVLDLALALHPTPAVCGHPRQPALEAISRLERFDRGFFCGITGWMDSRGDGEWAVTIRCGVADEASLRVFAGAGIVAGSVPENEWLETSAKLDPMLETFGVAMGEGQ